MARAPEMRVAVDVKTTTGPRSAFELTTVVSAQFVDAVAATEVARSRAVDAGLAVSETVRVEEQLLANDRWYWLVTLRVFPAPARSVSNDRRTVDAGGAS